MSHKTKDQNDKLAAKKAAVLGAQPKSRGLLWAAAACLVVLAAGWMWYSGGKTENQPAAAASAAAAGDVITLPVSLFDDGQARYFQHKHGDLAIRYFVIKSADGVLRAAFDACDVCWRAGKGYAQKGDFMVCRNCGQRFASNRVNEVKGGCNPAPLERRVENGAVVIRIADVQEGRPYFDFARKG